MPCISGYGAESATSDKKATCPIYLQLVTLVPPATECPAGSRGPSHLSPSLGAQSEACARLSSTCGDSKLSHDIMIERLHTARYARAASKLYSLSVKERSQEKHTATLVKTENRKHVDISHQELHIFN